MRKIGGEFVAMLDSSVAILERRLDNLARARERGRPDVVLLAWEDLVSRDAERVSQRVLQHFVYQLIQFRKGGTFDAGTVLRKTAMA